MKRADHDLGFILQYENIAWYDAGKVRILDRRVYPMQVRFVTCTRVQDVAQAIADMVTQSGGPPTAAMMGMVLAAYEGRFLRGKELYEKLQRAAYLLSHARPTTAAAMMRVTDACLSEAKWAIDYGRNVVEHLQNYAIEQLDKKFRRYEMNARLLADRFPKKGGIMTQCFGETVVGLMLREARERNLDLKIYCPETRPYLQGARLTSSCFAQMGFDTTVITDNMVAYSMERGLIDVFSSAADSIARSGHIANKIGTFQIAILAKHFGVPYYVTGVPDRDKMGRDDIVIEMRDPEQVLRYRGIANTLPEVKAIYPSFDVVPPHLISGVVTDKGVYVPHMLNTYFDTEAKQFY